MVEIYDDNYTEAFALECYYIDEAMNQRKILNFVTECIYLENGDYGKIRSLNESAADSIKGFFSRIWEFIKKVVNKFKERIAELFTTDKKFLEKYKDIILKKDWKTRNVSDAYEYKPEVLDKISSHPFNVNTDLSNIDKQVWVDNAAKELTEEMFINIADTELRNLKLQFKTNDITDLITYAVKGEDAKDDIAIGALYDRKTLYNWCYKIEATKNQITKNSADLTKVEGAITTAIQKKEKEMEDKEKNKPKATTETPNDEKQTGEKVEKEQPAPVVNSDTTQVDQSSTIYSNVYGGYITEIRTGSVQGDSSSSGKTYSTNGAQVGKVNISGTDAKKEEISQKEGPSKQINAYTEAYKNYFKYLLEIQTNCMNLTCAMYKDYMKLLRVHVRDYVGKDQGPDASNNAGNDAEQQSTEGGSNPQPKKGFNPFRRKNK